MDYVNTITSLKTPEALRDYLHRVGAEIDLVDQRPRPMESALRKPLVYTSALSGRTVEFANRWAILPMEGWDCHPNGSPSDLTIRRITRFGLSGAKLLFGIEGAAVIPSGRGNPNQLLVSKETIGDIETLLKHCLAVHRHRYGMDSDPYIGLQLTHAGRFCQPHSSLTHEPRIVYSHPILDNSFHCTAKNILTDGELDNIIAHYVKAAKLLHEVGFDFIDLLMGNGHLGHETLTAVERSGRFGGSFENRTRFFREIVAGIRSDVPGLDIAVRLSMVDFLPYERGELGIGRPMKWKESRYPFAFGGDGTGQGIDLTEPFRFLEMARSLGIRMIGTTLGSLFTTPHIASPAALGVVGSYRPPEDPLVGVARHIHVTRQAKKQFPDLFFVGSGYSYLQEFFPLVAESLIASGDVDFVGYGRLALSYPEFAADYQAGKPIKSSRICRTMGDCLNALRNGLVSGCYNYDQLYNEHTDRHHLKEIKSLLPEH